MATLRFQEVLSGSSREKRGFDWRDFLYFISCLFFNLLLLFLQRFKPLSVLFGEPEKEGLSGLSQDFQEDWPLQRSTWRRKQASEATLPGEDETKELTVS